MTIEELNLLEAGMVKFVEVDHKDIVFSLSNPAGMPRHIDIINGDDLDKVTGAGIIFLFPTYWKMNSRGSDSISNKINRPVGCSQQLEEKLISIIKREYRKENEYDY